MEKLLKEQGSDVFLFGYQQKNLKKIYLLNYKSELNCLQYFCLVQYSQKKVHFEKNSRNFN